MNDNAALYFVDRHIEEGRADKVAFREADGAKRSLTYGQLAQEAARFGGALERHGVRREERVAMIVQDQIEFPVIFWGALKAGAIPVPLNTLLSTQVHDSILSDSRASILVVSQSLWETVAPAVQDNRYLRAVVVIGDAPEGTENYQAFCKDAPEIETVEASADELAFWLYSSGSTGAPKGVRHVHSSLQATAECFSRDVLGIAEDDTVYSVAKMFFAYGLGNAMSFPMSVGATTVIAAGRPTPELVFRIMKEEKPTIFCGVPTLYAALVFEQEKAGTPPEHCIRLCTSAGEALPREVGERVRGGRQDVVGSRIREERPRVAVGAAALLEDPATLRPVVRRAGRDGRLVHPRGHRVGVDEQTVSLHQLADRRVAEGGGVGQRAVPVKRRELLPRRPGGWRAADLRRDARGVEEPRQPVLAPARVARAAGHHAARGQVRVVGVEEERAAAHGRLAQARLPEGAGALEAGPEHGALFVGQLGQREPRDRVVEAHVHPGRASVVAQRQPTRAPADLEGRQPGQLRLARAAERGDVAGLQVRDPDDVARHRQRARAAEDPRAAVEAGVGARARAVQQRLDARTPVDHAAVAPALGRSRPVAVVVHALVDAREVGAHRGERVELHGRDPGLGGERALVEPVALEVHDAHHAQPRRGHREARPVHGQRGGSTGRGEGRAHAARVDAQDEVVPRAAHERAAFAVRHDRARPPARRGHVTRPAVFDPRQLRALAEGDEERVAHEGELLGGALHLDAGRLLEALGIDGHDRVVIGRGQPELPSRPAHDGRRGGAEARLLAAAEQQDDQREVAHARLTRRPATAARTPP